MVRMKKINTDQFEKLLETAEAALEGQIVSMSMHMAACYIAACLAAAATLSFDTKMSKDEKRKQLVGSFESICDRAVEIFPKAKKFIINLRKNCERSRRCNMTQEEKDWIDNASYKDLLRRWRFAPAGKTIFQGEVGEYYHKVMGEKKSEIGNAEAVRVSKEIGF